MDEPITFWERVDNHAVQAANMIGGFLANARTLREPEFGRNNVLALGLATEAGASILTAGVKVNHEVAALIEEASDGRLVIPAERVLGRHP